MATAQAVRSGGTSLGCDVSIRRHLFKSAAASQPYAHLCDAIWIPQQEHSAFAEVRRLEFSVQTPSTGSHAAVIHLNIGRIARTAISGELCPVTSRIGKGGSLQPPLHDRSLKTSARNARPR